MPRSARRIGILLVIIVAAIAAFLSAGPSAGAVREIEEGDHERSSDDREAEDLVVDLYLV
ncbi:hypothetical protein [Nocardia arizonensis]|uniref:hypothetical protein n=1 Tax=Nocardia arizonensis TaxID=1141647 RepID=UPI0006D06571|nr:hypothetical protein [Nocardia arizonensis]